MYNEGAVIENTARTLDEYMKIAYTALPDFATDRNYDPSFLSYPSNLKAVSSNQNAYTPYKKVNSLNIYFHNTPHRILNS